MASVASTSRLTSASAPGNVQVGRHGGRPDDDLREVGESLRPGTSAYIAVVDTAHASGVARAFAAEGGRVLDMPVEMELSGAIRETLTHRIRRV